ncbi:hypothetical protein ACJW31_03G018300 [Castanea mollissima]
MNVKSKIIFYFHSLSPYKLKNTLSFLILLPTVPSLSLSLSLSLRPCSLPQTGVDRRWLSVRWVCADRFCGFLCIGGGGGGDRGVDGFFFGWLRRCVVVGWWSFEWVLVVARFGSSRC